MVFTFLLYKKPTERHTEKDWPEGTKQRNFFPRAGGWGQSTCSEQFAKASVEFAMAKRMFYKLA